MLAQISIRGLFPAEFNARELHRISVTDGNQHTSQFAYDAPKRLTATSYPDTTTNTAVVGYVRDCHADIGQSTFCLVLSQDDLIHLCGPTLPLGLSLAGSPTSPSATLPNTLSRGSRRRMPCELHPKISSGTETAP